jgi:nucleoside-diphosphate-sugar epimerase
MRYVVTGATGFIGGRLARRLVDAGHQVVTVARNPDRARDLADLGVAVYPGDITDPATLIDPMKGADGVFHVAGWYKLGARDTSPGRRINVEGTRNVLTVMRDLQIPRGVYTSTLAIFSDTHGTLPDESYYYDGPHLTEYDRTKWEAHTQVAEPMMRAGLPFTIVLPGVVYGPGDTSLVHESFRQYLRRRLLALPTKTAYCWAHVDDIAHGHVLAMEKGSSGKSYIIAGEPHTTIEVFDLAASITGIPAPRIHLPALALKITAQLVRPLERLLPLPGTYTYEGLMSTAGATYLGSNARARRELGYQPRPLAEGLAETLRWEAEQLGQHPRW